MNRTQLKNEAIKAIKNSYNLALEFATGTGKSKIAIDIFKALKLENSNILLVVGELAHKKNWLDEFEKWTFPTNNIKIICYASLKNQVDKSYDLVCYDEAHHLSEKRLEVVKTIDTFYNLFLSATLPSSKVYEINETLKDTKCFNNIKVLKCSLNDAIQAKILPEPQINIIPLILNNKDYTQEIIEKRGKTTNLQIINCTYSNRWTYLKDKVKYPNLELHISCTEQQKYDYLDNQIEYYKKRYFVTRNEFIKNKWLYYGSERKKYLGLLKTSVAYYMISKVLDGNRFICFCTNIEQAKLLGGNNAVHSKSNNNKAIINAFNDEVNSSLFAVNMLQEGVNLKNIEAGLIIQLDGEIRSFIQRHGRVLRSDNPVQYILYFKNTRDEEYLNNALSGIDKKYIKEFKIDEICN